MDHLASRVVVSTFFRDPKILMRARQLKKDAGGVVGGGECLSHARPRCDPVKMQLLQVIIIINVVVIVVVINITIIIPIIVVVIVIIS